MLPDPLVPADIGAERVGGGSELRIDQFSGQLGGLVSPYAVARTGSMIAVVFIGICYLLAGSVLPLINITNPMAGTARDLAEEGLAARWSRLQPATRPARFSPGLVLGRSERGLPYPPDRRSPSLLPALGNVLALRFPPGCTHKY